MKKIYLITMMATTLLGLAACSSDDLASISPSSTTTNDENVPINFGTYIGNAKSTRAGYEGGLINTTDQLKDAGGFAIFATNTETGTYKADQSDEHSLYNDFNYMFNQEVTWNPEGDGKWTTTPVKYWPNKTLQNSTDGKPIPQFVSFFAYAPYCKLIETKNSDTQADENIWQSDDFLSGGTDKFKGGIMAISDAKKFKSNMVESDQNTWYSYEDPIIAFDLKPSNSNIQPDLLWGTTGTNNGVSEDYNNEQDQNLNTGKKLTNNAGKEAAGDKGGEYSVNADLTKMKTDGKVSFAFKHALARIGGHKANEAASENSITIDAVADALKNGDTKQLANDTRISLKWLAIELCGDGVDENGKDVAYPTKGLFNLATGLWGQMATDPTNENHPVTYSTAEDPVYVLYPSAITQNADITSCIDNVKPYLNNKTTTTYVKVPLNPDLTVNGKGGDSYTSVITATAEDDTTDPVTPLSSTWNDDAKKGVETTATSVFVSGEDAKPLMIIPNNTVKPKLRVIASYDIVTLDPAYVDATGHEGYTKANQVVGQDITFKDVAQLNKKYNLHIHLGVTSMKVDATVEEWDVDTKTEGESVVEDTKDIDLPANVSGTTTPSTGE